MPLNPVALQQGLLMLDEPQGASDAGTMALRWFDAWWSFYSGCTALNPLTLPAARLAAQGVFVPLLTAGLTPNPVPVTFFLALEGAVRAAMAVTLTPAFLLPLWTVGVPSPIPLAPLLLPVVPVGMASGSAKPPARIVMAATLAGWTYSNLVVPLAPPNIPVPLF